MTNGRSAMIQYMSPLSTQRAKLLEAIEIASGIARCEPDAQAVRATVMYNLERNIDDFPVSDITLTCVITDANYRPSFSVTTEISSMQSTWRTFLLNIRQLSLPMVDQSPLILALLLLPAQHHLCLLLALFLRPARICPSHLIQALPRCRPFIVPLSCLMTSL